jgi:NADH dehydrogenase
MTPPASVVITGANGFVGRYVVRAVARAGASAAGVVRSDSAAQVVEAAGGEVARVAGLGADELRGAIEGAQAVVHLAQIGAERGSATYEEVNVGGTQAVVDACRCVGVGRVVFLSGLGVAHYGIWPRCTNPYFLSKLAAEACLLRSGLEVAILRPSYILGPGGELVADLLGQMKTGRVEQVGDGRHRMQPIAVEDAADLVATLATGVWGADAPHRVFDLVGPEALSLRAFTERVARVAGAYDYVVEELSEQDADRRARAGGYRGMLPDELDCMLCDEVGDAAPLETVLGRPLRSLDAVLREAMASVG